MKQYTWVYANHGFLVHTLCHYCEMVATSAGNKVSKHLEAGELQVKDEGEIQHLGTNNTVGFQHLQLLQILALSPQVTLYIAWVLAKYIQVWNQDSLGVSPFLSKL